MDGRCLLPPFILDDLLPLNDGRRLGPAALPPQSLLPPPMLVLLLLLLAGRLAEEAELLEDIVFVSFVPFFFVRTIVFFIRFFLEGLGKKAHKNNRT